MATTANANSLANNFDVQKVQDQMALASTVGDVGALATNVVSTAMQREAYVAKDHAMAEAEANLTPAQLAVYNSKDYQEHPEKKAAYLQALAMSPENLDQAWAKNPDLAAQYEAATTEAGRQAVLNKLARTGDLGSVVKANQQFLDAQNKFGPGSDFSRTAQALSGLAAGLASGNNGQALSNLTQPYLASAIGTYFDKLELQPDGTKNHEYAPERLLAHAAAGAAIAYLSGNNAASGATGAASGEAMAIIVHDQLYGNKPTDQLTTSEKESIRAVATLAAGLAGALQGGSFETAATSAAAGYNAAVNNQLGIFEQKPFAQDLQSGCGAGKSSTQCQNALSEWKEKSYSRVFYSPSEIKNWEGQVESYMNPYFNKCQGDSNCVDVMRTILYTAQIVMAGDTEGVNRYLHGATTAYFDGWQGTTVAVAQYVQAGLNEVARGGKPTVSAVRGNGGGKNAQHASQAKKEVAAKKYEDAKAEFDRLDKMPNKTPEIKALRDKAAKTLRAEKLKMENAGENHSMKPKGNR